MCFSIISKDDVVPVFLSGQSVLDEEARKLSVRKLSMRKLSSTSNSIFSAIKEAVVGPQKQQQEMEVGRKMSTVSNSIFSTIKDAMVGPSRQQDPEATLCTDHKFTHPSRTDGSGIVDFNKHAVISETEEEHQTHTPNRSKVMQLVLQIMLCILFLAD